MYIKYNQQGEILGQVSWSQSNDPDVAQIDDTLFNSMVNPKYINDQLIDQNNDPIFLSNYRANLVNQVNNICQSRITGPQTSNALGSQYYYQSELTDQLNFFVNMNVAVSQNKSVPQKCSVDNVNYSFVNHTPTQMQQVFNDCYSKILGWLQNANNLKNSINSTTTWDQLKTIDINSGW